MNEQSSPAERLAALPEADRAAFLSSLSETQAEALLYDWRGFHARPAQIAPDGEWNTWLALAGRGFGKTRMGAEWVKERVAAGSRSIALIAETQKDLEEVLVPRLVAIYPPHEAPAVRFKPVRVTWANGAIALGYNGTEPNQLRGPEFDTAWVDELAKYRHAQETWDMLQFALRSGSDPRQIVTTTPRPIDVIRMLVGRAVNGDGVVMTRGSTLDNASNLAPTFLSEVKRRYEGTRLGRQEIEAEILDDAPGALWTRRTLDEWRRKEAPKLRRVVVAIDPAVTSGEDADEHGIVIAAQGEDGRGYVLGDHSTRGTPEKWARKAIAAYHQFEADRIVAEVNNGGEMVERVIRSVDPNVPVTLVRASRGKHTRAEPISSLYEQGRVSHIGAFPTLEDQMVLMTAAGFEGSASPDRLDALVWALSEFFPAMTIRQDARPIKYGKLANVA